MRKRFLYLIITTIIVASYLLFIKPPAQSQNTDKNFVKANSMLIKGNYSDAITLYQLVIKQNPKNADAYMGLGMAFKAQGNFNEAYNATIKSIKLKPNYYQAYYNLGLILENLNNPKEAIITYEKFLKEVPGADRFSDVKQRISILKKNIKNQ